MIGTTICEKFLLNVCGKMGGMNKIQINSMQSGNIDCDNEFSDTLYERLIKNDRVAN